MLVLVILYICNKSFASRVIKDIPEMICDSVFISLLLQDMTLTCLNEKGIAEIKQQIWCNEFYPH